MSKFIKLIRSIADKTANVKPYTEEAYDRYMAERIKKLMEQAYKAGWEEGWYDASKVDW